MAKPELKNEKIISTVQSSERKAELESGLEGVMNKERELNSKEVINQNKIKEVKGKVIKALFNILQEIGVDASDLESINSFLSTLEETNPDLLSLFELVFTDLMPGAEQKAPAPEVGQGPGVIQGMAPPAATPPGVEAPNAGLMNNYKNLAQDKLMPRQ